MTYDDFVNNWLTLATDVKIGGAGNASSIWVPDGKERRNNTWRERNWKTRHRFNWAASSES